VDQEATGESRQTRTNSGVRLPSTARYVALPLVIVLAYIVRTAFDARTGTDAIGALLQVILVIILAGLIAILFDRSW
jgi:hypothetical protein